MLLCAGMGVKLSRRATLRDVALRAGVSTATVARVLHGRGYVAADTRQAVERALGETGYSLNLLAQGLRRQRTGIFGHVLHAIYPNPFYAEVALGVEQEAMAHGYSVLAYNVQGDPGRERAGVQTLIQRRVDAIIFTTPIDAENVRLALAAGIPVVQVERPTPVPTPVVLLDNYVGTTAAMEHLILLGHRRIAFIGAGFERQEAPPPWSIEEQRFYGYRDTLGRHGMPFERDWVGLGQYYSLEADASANDGYRFSAQLLDLSPRPTAILAACDLLAAGVLQAAYERRLRIPGDLSVVGFDNTLAPCLSPPLTTVAQPMLQIGQAATRLALGQVQGEEQHGAPAVSLPLRLVVRASTGPVA